MALQQRELSTSHPTCAGLRRHCEGCGRGPTCTRPPSVPADSNPPCIEQNAESQPGRAELQHWVSTNRHHDTQRTPGSATSPTGRTR